MWNPLRGVLGVIDHAELRSARPYQAQLVICVHVLRVEKIRRHRRNPDASRSHHAPRLAAEDFPMAGPKVNPVQPHPERVRVAAHVQVGGSVAEKVRFEIAR